METTLQKPPNVPQWFDPNSENKLTVAVTYEHLWRQEAKKYPPPGMGILRQTKELEALRNAEAWAAKARLICNE